MKKPISFAAYSTIAIIPLTIIVTILAAIVFFATASLYASAICLPIIIAMLFMYYGFAKIGQKTKNKLLHFSSWYCIAGITISTIIIFAFINYFQTTIYSSFKETITVDNQLYDAYYAMDTTIGEDALKELSVDELVSQGLDRTKVENYKQLLAVSQSQNQKVEQYLYYQSNSFAYNIAFFLILVLSFLPFLLFTIGIYQLHKHDLKIAKATGIIGIIIAGFNILTWILSAIALTKILQPGAIQSLGTSQLISLSAGMMTFFVISQLILALSIAFYILKIVLLFNASEKLEKISQ